MKSLILIVILCLDFSITVKINQFKSYPRFSSFKGYINNTTSFSYRCKVPFTDTYTVTYSTDIIKSLQIKKENGELLSTQSNSFEISLVKYDRVLIVIEAKKPNSIIEFSVTAKDHFSLFPYDPIDFESNKNYDLYGNKNEDPLKEAHIEYVKRTGGIYINDNNPEILTNNDLNKGLVRNDISNREVFFTFEHNNQISDYFYYGYQVINRGNKNAYITIKNIGPNLDGPGRWHGEKEWIYFYNQKFRLIHKDEWTESQKANFQASYGFCDTYEPQNFQPITYLLPPGKHFYAFGGTTEDSYLNINVANTADHKVKGQSSNGAVLFDVVGDNVEGVFYVYQDPKDVTIENTSHQGYIIHKPNDDFNYGNTYNGYDTCKGVVDMHAEWTFNDNTPSQSLPVTFDNYYLDNVPHTADAYGKIDSTKHTQHVTIWNTHLNPQNDHNNVGTDMTKYITVNSEKNTITIDPDHRDGLGNVANIGNWMIDYFDSLNFVNQGDKDRQITIKFMTYYYSMVAVMVRDEDGNVIDGTRQYAFTREKSEYGDAIDNHFEYTTTIKAHSYLTLHVEYNLVANSYGRINHEVILE